MKIANIVLVVVLILTGFIFSVRAQEAAVAQGQAIQAGNKVCPVSGEKIVGDTGMNPVTYEYKGKIYNLCCQGCVSMFQKDPEKYSAIVDQEVSGSNDQMKVLKGDMPIGHKM